jgi:hypothetical protein
VLQGSSEIAILESRSDPALPWDPRVHPDARGSTPRPGEYPDFADEVMLFYYEPLPCPVEAPGR